MSALRAAAERPAATPASEPQLELPGGEPSLLRSALGRALRRPTVILAAFWLIVVVLATALAGQIAPYNPLAQNLSDTFAGPSLHHLLGTDELGRDILTRLLYGGRGILVGSLEAVAVAVAIGVPLGLLAGFTGKAIDAVSSFLVNVLFSIPGFVVLVAVAFITNDNLSEIMLALGVLASAQMLRLVRSTTQGIRNLPYVDYARMSGLTRRRILFRHVLPNVLGPLLVQVFYLFSLSFILASSLSFLALGFNPETPSWGQMVFEASQNIYLHGFEMVPVGFVLIATVLALNLIGNAVRAALPQSAQHSLLVSRGARILTATGLPARPETPSRETASRETAPLAGAAVPDEGKGGTSPAARRTLVALEGLSISFPRSRGERLLVVDDVSLRIGQGESLGLVGESGSGKTLSALALLGLVPPPGEVSASGFSFDEVDLLGDPGRLASLRGRDIGFVSQEPMVALDPCFTVGSTLSEPLRRHRGMSRGEARVEVLEMLRRVGINDPELVARRYPHQLSGGMAQRVSIAMALAGNPRLLVADEPTTALDVTVQAEILDLLRSLQEESELAMLLVSHDLGVIADVCENVAVMYAGQIVEFGAVADILTSSTHPYTLTLIAAVAEEETGEQRRIVSGAAPAPGSWPTGCRFADRCPLVVDECRSEPVALSEDAGRLRRCVRPPEVCGVLR